jgi:hypothetical protein
MQPKPEAVAEFQEYAQTYFRQTVFGTKCRTWYKAGNIDGPSESSGVLFPSQSSCSLTSLLRLLLHSLRSLAWIMSTRCSIIDRATMGRLQLHQAQDGAEQTRQQIRLLGQRIDS